MVIDTSAFIAILQAEPERDSMLNAMTRAPRLLVSAATVLETSMVLEGRFGREAGSDLEIFLFEAKVDVAPFDSRQAAVAVRAWRKYGKGRHPAQLNFGDCCVYGLARSVGEPVLCKGNDFLQTDIACVLCSSDQVL
jgi:ribonuclease VapC